MLGLKFKVFAVVLVCLLMVRPGNAQKLKSLVNFDSANGAYPQFGSLVEINGSFYGTTSSGGPTGLGTVFRVTPQGTLTILYSFCSQNNCADGGIADGGLIVHDGMLYGTTVAGGSNNGGTVFQLTLDGALTTLHSFSGTDGSGPLAGLAYFQGALYGTTQGGGANFSGTIYRIALPGLEFSTLHNFCSEPNCADGYFIENMLTPTKHELWGVTAFGGARGHGTVFRVSPSGAFQAVRSFSNVDGGTATGRLLFATDGNLYGTTSIGGSRNDGTIFQLTTNGKFKTLYNFCMEALCTDGAIPEAGLSEDKDGNFYGTTYSGGPSGYGTIFEITPSGELTTLHTFTGFLGAFPFSGLVQGSDGAFYGTTSVGGGSPTCSAFPVGCGMVYALWK